MIKLSERFSSADDLMSECDFPFDDCEVDYEVEALPGEELRRRCAEFFAPSGPLCHGDFGERSYEVRPQQNQMAEAICDALINGRNLCVEAPTGVGKSFAYLVPLLLRSRYCKRPAVVSTETINLQEQLIYKDIPMLGELIGFEFKAALAKGRRNYLCRRRLAMLEGEQRDALLPSPSLIVDLERISRGLSAGESSGDRDSFPRRIDPAVWGLVCCEVGNCLGPKCSFYRSCFYYQARRRWEEADLIIANHALFFTDLAMRSLDSAGALLPDYGAVLIDEAHTLENNAAEYLGLYLSRQGITGELNRLFNPDNSRGLLMRAGNHIAELRAAVAEARDEAWGFFQPYENLLSEKRESALSISTPERFPDRLTPALLKLCSRLGKFVEDEEDPGFKTELSSHLSRCSGFVDALDQFTHQTMPDAVYYVESERGGVSLRAAPLNVGELLEKMLFRQDFPVVLCSATLTVRNRFDYFVGRTGFCDGETLRLDSPFSPDQARLLVPGRMPDPASSEYPAALVEEIYRYVEMTDGKAFVLFTSYQTLRYCADALRDRFASRGWNLLMQGGEQSRHQLLMEFREDVNSVLFGTDSFWTGVDVPGEALSNVIVTKLPFAVPSHPLIAARMARIESTGKSSFSEYSLPEAVLKFRQGVGRLIRSRNDRGIIVVLDRRAVSKGYGRTFLGSVPYRVEVR